MSPAHHSTHARVGGLIARAKQMIHTDWLICMAKSMKLKNDVGEFPDVEE
jgi:hypothetical protein